MVWLAVGAMSALALGYGFEPGRLEDYERVANPLGVAGSVADTLKVVGFPAFALAAVLSMASLVLRFRRSVGIERQQIKWMATAATLVVFAWLATAFLDGVFGVNASYVLQVTLVAIPAAAAIAVLRYRLYDLDLVVNRTLVYGALTATLAGTYLGSVLLLQLALDSVTSGSSLAVAVSTLAVAALFRPARNRIQRLVDRRFYRRKYDAAQTLEAFGHRLREEVELDALGRELRDVVSRTVQPAHVSLWLRSP